MSQTVITIIRNVDTKSVHQELVRAPEAASDVSLCIRICRKVPDSCYAYWTIEKDRTGRRKPCISLQHAIWKLKQLSYPRLHNQDDLVLRSERFVHYKRNIEQYWPTPQEVSHLCPTVSWSTTRSTFSSTQTLMRGNARQIPAARSTDLQGLLGIWGELCRKILGGTGATERA
jgi:hypothetical protein